MGGILLRRRYGGLARRGGKVKAARTMRSLQPSLRNENGTPEGVPFSLAEKMGFEPMCPKPDNRISSAARYDHFDTFP